MMWHPVLNQLKTFLALYLLFSAAVGTFWLIELWRAYRFDKKVRACVDLVDVGRRYNCSICGKTWFLPDVKYDNYDRRERAMTAMLAHRLLEHNL